MHKIADKVEEYAAIPVLHIADSAARELRKNNMRRTLMISTKQVMDEPFLKDKFEDEDIKIIIPCRGHWDTLENSRQAAMLNYGPASNAASSFFSIAERYGTSSALVCCSKFNAFFKPDQWLVADKTIHNRKFLFFNAAGLHVRAAVERAAEKTI